ncbi:MAG: DUF3102 domain-containing protein [Anaerovoracaceae bacterium]
MNEIVDVEYTEISDLSEKSTEELAAEANTLWNQMEDIGNLGLMMAAQAGQRLNVIKSRLAHGQWEDWAKSNLQFSVRKANRMMDFAEKMKDENSIFSNPTTLSDLGISKVWALLAAPEEVAEEIIKNPNATEMSVREFQDEIRRLKEENAGLKAKGEETADQLDAAGDKLVEAEKQIKELEAEIQIYKEAPVKSEESEKEIARLQAELEKAHAAAEKEKKKAEKEKEESRKLQESLETEKQKAAEEAAQFAVEKANAKFEEDNRMLIESNRQAAEEIDRLQRMQENSQEVAEFKVHSDQLQASFLKCLSCTQKVDGQLAENMKTALRTVMEQLTARI